MLIAISTYLKPLEEVDVHRATHHAYLKPLFDSKKLLISGRQADCSGGVIMTNTLSRDEFATVLQADPFEKAGVAKYHIYEFNPSFYDESLSHCFERP